MPKRTLPFVVLGISLVVIATGYSSWQKNMPSDVALLGTVASSPPWTSLYCCSPTTRTCALASATDGCPSGTTYGGSDYAFCMSICGGSSSSCCAEGTIMPGLGICSHCVWVPIPDPATSSSSSSSDIPCTADLYPVCDGTCPPGQTCFPRGGGGQDPGTCSCEPDASSSSEPNGACCNARCISENVSRDRCGFFANFYPGQSCTQVSDCQRPSSSSIASQGPACCIGNSCMAFGRELCDANHGIYFAGKNCDKVNCAAIRSSSSSSLPYSDTNCCLCLYQDFPGCASRTDRTDCWSWVSEFGTPDCKWENNACITRFKKYCEDWQGTQTQCSAQKSYTQNESAPLPDLSSCTNLTQIRMGHGLGCGHLMQIVKGCVRQCKNATCMSFEDLGCSVFADTTKAEQWINTQRLFYMGREQTITVSANQTTAGWPTCQNRITYTMSVSEVKKEYEPCKPGTYCYSGSKPIACFDEATQSVVQLSCCKCYDGNNVWSDTQGHCPAPKEQFSGTCASTVLSLVSCKSAAETAVKRRDACLQAIKCIPKDLSDLQTTVLPVSIAPGNMHDYNSSCFVRVETKYRCMGLCKK